jgi:hypothetical protein
MGDVWTLNIRRRTVSECTTRSWQEYLRALMSKLELSPEALSPLISSDHEQFESKNNEADKS